MGSSLISVIVPIYKVEAYLDKCVRSIVDQTYRDLEIILVDDGSPDNCGAICEDWATKDSRIKVVHKENGGLSDARNAGLAIATGELISFIDSDDWIEPEFLRTLSEAMQQQDAQIAECAIHLVSEEGEILRRRGPKADEVLGKIEALRQLVLERKVYQTVWNKLYRREVVDGILFEKGKYNEDDFWTYQVFDRIEQLALVAKPMYNYLQRGGSIMGVGYSLKRLDGIEARYLRWQYLQKYEELSCLTRQQYLFECLWHLQNVLRNLNGADRDLAKQKLLNWMKQTPKVSGAQLQLDFVHRVWYILIRKMPVVTAKMRNLLRIGL